jgi:uncharacterized membrane protein
MNSKSSVFKSNIIYGLLVIVPLAVIFLFLSKIVEILEKVAKHLSMESYFNASLAVIIGLFLLLAVCFLIGALVRTRIGSLSFERLENKVLKQIPGYQIISNALKGFASQETAYPKAMVQLFGSETSVLAFVIEENDNDSVTVFVPSSPAITVGTVYIVARSRVTILEASTMEIADCLSQWGVGSRKIIGGKGIEASKV